MAKFEAPPLTPEQQRLLDQLTGKYNTKIRRENLGGSWVNYDTWSNSSTPTDGYGRVRIKNNIDTKKKAILMASKKFVASLVIEENKTDKYDNGIKVNLMQIQLTDDDLSTLLRRAHGHLELVEPVEQDTSR